QYVQLRRSAELALKFVYPGSEKDAELRRLIARLSAYIGNFDPAAAQNELDTLTPLIAQAEENLEKLKEQGWSEWFDVRLKQVRWMGTLHDYLYAATAYGRPISNYYFPNGMPAWDQSANGPLQSDQIEDVTAYILNFHDSAVRLTPQDIAQDFVIVSLP